MSSDNFLNIRGKGPFKAYDCFIEEGGKKLSRRKPDFTAKTIREAVVKAQEYMEKYLVEYGYYFTDL